MNISQLLRSTEYLDHFKPSYTFTQKKFGDIYLYNKVVRVKPGSSIIEVSMMIKGATERVFTARQGSKTVAAHKVMIAIRGVEQEVLSNDALFDKIKTENKSLEEGLDKRDILYRARRGEKLLPDKTIFVNQGGGFVVVSDKISKESEIRVWCSCASYYWVFQYYNVENNVDIWGKAPDKYIPKTKKGWEAFKSGKPMRNPGRHPGMCKHLLLLLALLMDDDTISEARGITANYRANLERFNKVNRLGPKKYQELLNKYHNDRRRQNLKRQMERASEAGYAGDKGFEKNKAFIDGKWKETYNYNKNFNPNTGKFKWERKHKW